MDKSELLNRIHALEKELVLLKTELAPPKTGTGVAAFFKRLPRLLISNWVLISFITAIVTAVYVKYRFDIDYFESYKNIKIAKDISSFYTEMGEKLMIISEWEAAKEAYTRALENNKNNMQASFGLMKATAFDPAENGKNVQPEVVDARVDLLVSKFPEDYMVHFLNGVRYMNKNDLEKAVSSFNKSIALKPDFISTYIELGYLNMGSYDAKTKTIRVNHTKSIEYSKKAVTIDSNNAIANNNLGYSLLLRGQIKQGIMYLEKANNQSPSLLTMINIGEAYRLCGTVQTALWYHTKALERLEATKDENDRFISGVWCYNFLPIRADDTVTVKNYVKIAGKYQKLAFANYALSLDYALQDNFNAATKHLAAALQCDRDQYCEKYFRNTISSLDYFLTLKPGFKAWVKKMWPYVALK